QGGKGNGKGDSGPNEGGIGEGRRELGKLDNYKGYDAKQRTEFIEKGKKIFDGFAPGQNVKGKTTAEIAGEDRQAAQEMSESIEAQRIPKAARDIVRGYYDQLRGGTDDKLKKK